MGRGRLDLVLGHGGHRRLLWILALVEGVIGLADLSLPSTTLLPYYFVVVLLSAIFATPRQMVPLIVLAYALGIGVAYPLGFSLSIDYWLRLIALTIALIVAVVLAAQRCQLLEVRSHLEKKLAQRATTDSLTHLLNREEVFEQIGQLQGYNKRQGRKLAVLFCDLDCFKDVNDNFGHQAGDAVLRAMADRVRACLRASDLAARIGGDELLVALTGVHGLGDAVAIAEKLRHLAQQPVLLPDGEVQISVSVGVALAEDGESIDELLARADDAMYRAKRQGRNRVVAIPPRER